MWRLSGARALCAASARPPLMVVAVGGNALQCANGDGSPAELEAACRVTARDIAAGLAGDDGDGAARRRVCLVSGNGPQVGALFAAQLGHTDLSSCVAETEGLLGAALQRAILATLPRGTGTMPAAVSLLTHTRVSAADAESSSRNPTKPIGSYLTKEEDVETARASGFTVCMCVGGLEFFLILFLGLSLIFFFPPSLLLHSCSIADVMFFFIKKLINVSFPQPGRRANRARASSWRLPNLCPLSRPARSRSCSMPARSSLPPAAAGFRSSRPRTAAVARRRHRLCS
jgi:hypothetical protein